MKLYNRKGFLIGLLRDERDREVDAQGAGKAGRAVLWASQLLAVLCIWQGDPAWAALLALTFVFAAAKFFHRFAADREGPPLLLGLAAAAALGYFVFRWRGFAHPGRLTAAFLLLGLLRLPKSWPTARTSWSLSCCSSSPPPLPPNRRKNDARHPPPPLPESRRGAFLYRLFPKRKGSVRKSILFRTEPFADSFKKL